MTPADTSYMAKFMPPKRIRELDHMCMKISGFALFFSNAPEARLDELSWSFPHPDRFFDGPPNVGDAKKYMVATLKAALAVLEESS